MIDGLPGVLQHTVVEKDVPGLLPLSFQEKQGALITLGTNKIHLPRLEAIAHMHRTSGGHRTIDVTWGLTPSTFRVSDGIPQRYGLSWDQFVVKSVPKNTPAVRSQLRNSHWTNTRATDETTGISLRASRDVGHEAVSPMTTLGDHTTDVITRADDRWARMTLLLWSHREEERRQLIKPNRSAGVAATSTCTHPAPARQKGANQYARWENCLKCQQRLVTEKRDCWKEARLLLEKALEKEEDARRMEEQKNQGL